MHLSRQHAVHLVLFRDWASGMGFRGGVQGWGSGLGFSWFKGSYNAAGLKVRVLGVGFRVQVVGFRVSGFVV